MKPLLSPLANDELTALAPRPLVDELVSPSGEILSHITPEPEADPSKPRSIRRRFLVLLDLVTVALSISVVQGLVHGWTFPGATRTMSLLSTVAVTIGAIFWERLHLARVCAIRSVEVVRLARVVALTSFASLALDRVFATVTSAPEIALRAGVCFVGLVAVRGAFRTWLHGQRRKGLYTRPVIIVGTPEESLELYRLARMQPQLGYDVRGFVCGPEAGRPQDLDIPRLGDLSEVVPALRRCGATGALLASSGMATSDLNRVVRELLAAGAHIHLSNGLRGIYYRRLVAQPLAHEHLLYLERRVSLSGPQMALKRGIDLTVGTVAFLLSLPVIALAAAAIKICDRGPVFFTQQRVGLDRRPFTIFKLRTMQTDAEQRLTELQDFNQRSGPLFKVAHDPRVTKVGKLLRTMSIDELPQLINVLKGDMSLVGPRPALPMEVERFDQALLHQRHQVRPGITGLWQVEARDDPSFGSYHHWDTFYVDNWSVLFDLAILVSTAQQSLGRALRFLRRSHRSSSPDGRGSGIIVLD